MPSGGLGNKCGKNTSARFFSATGEFIVRIPLARDEEFDHNRVYEMLPKISKQKPKTGCKIHCYTSEIKLKRATVCKSQPPRKSYSYKDIHRYYSFASNPDIIILACTMPTSNARSYDFLRLNERRAQELPLLIDRARSHPLYLLLDEYHSEPAFHTSPLVQRNIENNVAFSESPEVKGIQGRSMSEHSGLESLSEVFNANVEHSFFSHNQDKSHSSSSRSRSSSALHCKITHVTYEKPDVDMKTHPLDHDPLFKEMCANIGKNEVYDLDMIYVNPEAKQAKRDTSVGNVFLFVARYAKDDKELEDYYKKSGTVDCNFVVGSPKIACH